MGTIIYGDQKNKWSILLANVPGSLKTFKTVNSMRKFVQAMSEGTGYTEELVVAGETFEEEVAADFVQEYFSTAVLCYGGVAEAASEVYAAAEGATLYDELADAGAALPALL